jgi:hypothetical protein
MTSFLSWIKKFQKITSISVIVILFAIGSGMIIRPVLKLYILDLESSPGFNPIYVKSSCNGKINNLSEFIMSNAEQDGRFRKFLINSGNLEKYDALVYRQKMETKRRWQSSKHNKSRSEILQEKKEECIKETTRSAREHYIYGRKEHIIDGFVVIFIASFLWFFSRRKDKK